MLEYLQGTFVMVKTGALHFSLTLKLQKTNAISTVYHNQNPRSTPPLII